MIHSAFSPRSVKQVGLVLLLSFGLSLIPGRAEFDSQFSISDGKSEAAVLSMGPSETSAQGDGIEVKQRFDGKQSPHAWTIVLTNTGSEERWLYLDWRLTWKGSTALEELAYWNGGRKPIRGQALQGETASNAEFGPLMLQAIYDGEEGLALALDPMEIVPVFEQSLEHDEGGYRLHLRIPLVLSAGESDTVPLEIYSFRPRYGYLDALQEYYAAHPEAFTARSDIDPRAAGVGAAYTAWGARSFEKTRRFGGDWDWCYAPFKRTGDIYGREALWNYEPARPFTRMGLDLSAEAYREQRVNRFQESEKTGAAFLYYVPAFSYCEEALAKERYPEAISYRANGEYSVYYDRPWVTGHDNEVLMYPWGNSFAEQSQRDARQIVEEHALSGFAYDVLTGGRPFRGAGMEQSPRRSFDEDGAYVDLSVGIAQMMNFTRDLERDGRKVALVGNPSVRMRSFLVARCDGLMCEHPPYKQAEHVDALRVAAGHKPITWWDDWWLASFIDWEGMSTEELKEAYLGAADYVRLISYRYGGYPSRRLVEGIPSVARELPRLKEVVTSGWQAVPALRSASGDLPDFIWPSRYEKGLGTYFTIGNASREAWRGEVVIDNDYLGATNYLFVDESGTPLSQKVEGRSTVLSVEIPSHDTLVLRAVAEVSPTESGEALVTWKDDGKTGQLRLETSLVPSAVTAVRAGWGEGVADGEPSSGRWIFASLSLATPAHEIREFPFFGEKSRALVVLPENPTPEESWAAERIQDYFRFWGREGVSPTRALALPVKNGSVSSDSEQIRIEVSEAFTKIRREGNRLQVGKSAQGSIREATLQLFRVLDQKYFYSGKFPTRGEGKDDTELLEKLGLGGTTLER